MKPRHVLTCSAVTASLLLALTSPTAFSEVILQYFNTSYNEIAFKMPELAEVGYGAIWLPPPTKASGGLSTGYDVVDPFDLGSTTNRGSVSTLYGTEAELLNLISVAHRFGIRVYFDNIMNHRAFDVPGYDENTAINLYPGMLPEDFHLRVTQDGFYRKWDNVADWSDVWQVQHRNFSDLIDIAQETPMNENFGATEGSQHKKISFVRQPDHPEFYCYTPSSTGAVYVGFGTTNITSAMLTNPANAWVYSEDVGAFLIRAVRWLVDRTKVDGLRLDAVKHVPSYFFGDQYGASKDSDSAGYCGSAQAQFNLTRGYSDWNNHRDSVFSMDIARDDLMMFGEHLGEPPSYSEYIAAGMRLVNSQLKGNLNNIFYNHTSMSGLDSPSYSGSTEFDQYNTVTFAKSHDDDSVINPELHFAYYLTRQGLPNIYTDGNHQSATLAQSGGAFPRHANTAFLGQFNDSRLPNLVYIHNQFARGTQTARWADSDVVAYERIDKRENTGMSDVDGCVLFFAMCDNMSSGQYREIPTTFPAASKLWQYSTAGGNFYYTVTSDQKIKVIVPPDGYFAFSWRSPEESDLWKNGGGKPVTIYQNGQPAGSVSYVRRDGPDGDPAFNPYGVPDPVTNDYAYTWSVPRVTSTTNLRFVARADGSANNVMFRLDGGIDINSQMGIGPTNTSQEPALRDNAPGINPLQGTDLYLGYEQARFVERQYPEKFAAVDSSRDKIGSAGAETYVATIGQSGFTTNLSDGINDWDATYTASWIYHDPNANDEWGNRQLDPAPASASTQVTFRVKVGYTGKINNLYLYYVLGTGEWPEGAGGNGIGNTGILKLNWYADGAWDGTGTPTWWSGTLPGLTNGTVVRYKLGAFKVQNGDTNQYPYVPYDVPFPNSDTDIARKMKMMGVWEITNFNAQTIVYMPHNDYSSFATGLVEGFHVISARVFLQRDGRASIYNTFVQPFYFDASTPTGQVVFPQNDGDTLGGQQYGAVVRTDPTVVDVWYHVDDANPANDDGATTNLYGNGNGTNGQPSWVEAYTVTPSLSISNQYPSEWRFTYMNIPTGGTATIKVRLLELSSSTNMSLSDSAGHFTTLQRTVNAAAPSTLFYFDWPTQDGTTLQAGWTIRVKFSNSLGDGLDDTTFLNRFLITIDDSAQGRSAYRLTRDIGGGLGQLEYDMPDLYNGDTNFLHHIAVTFLTSGGVTLETHRYVKVQPVAAGPVVQIISPPAYDSDGAAYVITLPDVASPSATQRQYMIQVETDLSAKNVWIQFTNSIGYVTAQVATSNALSGLISATSGTNAVTGAEKTLSGTVSVTLSNATVTGSGTVFSNELVAGNTIRIGTNLVVVTQIVSQTSLTINVPYPGTSGSGLSAYQEPAFDVELQAGNLLLISTNFVTVSQVVSSSNLLLTSAYPGATVSGVTARRVGGNPTISGGQALWNFLWTNMTQGYFHFYANVNTNDATTNQISAQALRDTRVIFRQIVAADTNKPDWDDDGIFNSAETTPTNLPAGNDETWVNGDVHIYKIYGRTDPLKPDTDGDGLPDGLESGWRVPAVGTDTNTDTNGDGWPNFISDLDPPFFNTLDNYGKVPGVNSADEGGDRTLLVRGSMTDPNNPDSDYDGVPDGIEDQDRNGWVDGDGDPIPPAWDPWLARNWPTGHWTTNWVETDPNNPDTDGDSLADGYGEDKNYNGYIDGDTNKNRRWDPGELWTETDPLNPDTDGDGLPDGWEVQYGLDPLDDGVIGHTNMHTGLVIANTINGASGNPDGDSLVQNGVTNAYVNLLEYQNGTNPRIPDNGAAPPVGSITIGRGSALGVINGVTNYQEFTEWTTNDLIALDYYEGDGPNNQGGDIYMLYDGYDNSRDMVAFYARDGGDPGLGGDGKFYFRVDLRDLQANAEEGFLDLYVVINFGNPAVGEMVLPDEVDCMTSNRWQAVVAAYQSHQGRIYIDTIRDAAHNTTSLSQNLYDSYYGVVSRDQNAVNGFIDSYYNSDLDSVEFAVSRQALLDAGWNGLSATGFNYNVFATKDGTCNTCNNGGPGAGDLGGRNDLIDSIWNDYISEDYWNAQASISSVLNYWFNGSMRTGRAKTAVVLHGNQAIQPGRYIQNLINTGTGAGYYRPLQVHELYQQPLNLHITPTLASALQWAKTDPGVSDDWRKGETSDGPSFNAWVARLYQTNLVDLLGSTFSDHILPYFTKEFNRDNEALANEFLNQIYGFTPTANTVFWTPERVLDADTFSKILDLGYSYTLIDQNPHMFRWFDWNTALGDGGYKINSINGVNCFVINNGSSDFRFENDDNGLNLSLRDLYNRKARDGIQDQVVTLFSDWEDFTNNGNADAYDANVRWIANHPWVQMATFKQITSGQIPIYGNPSWYIENRGTNPSLSKVAQDWVQYSTEDNYDNWYDGSAQEESLLNKHFEIRPGTNVPEAYGMMYFPGIVTDAWLKVTGVADTNLAKLARGVLHASVFETAFHDQPSSDLSKFSTGAYVNPDATSNNLASLSKWAQSQTRMAAILKRVDTWGFAPPTNSTTSLEDVDLDGENEYLLYNDRLFALFERIGGRLVGVWVRDLLSGRVYEAAGNFLSYAGSEDETEGTYNVDSNGAVVAYRTSCLKDWWATTKAGTNSTLQYINDLYTFTDLTNGWRMSSSDSRITKTVMLAPRSWQLNVQYQLPGPDHILYVRNGLSPNLYDLLLHGQQTLGGEQHSGGVMTLQNTNFEETVVDQVGYGDAGHNTGFNTGARDDDWSKGVTNYTVGMRDQAQTHQVEIVGTNSFAFALSFQAQLSDWDGDGMPNTWEAANGFNPTNPADANGDADTNGIPNWQKYVMGVDPHNPTDYLHSSATQLSPTGIVVRFPTELQRWYYIWYANSSIMSPPWAEANTNPISGTGGTYEWVDDGSLTAPAPTSQSLTNRFYRIEVQVPK